MLSGDRVTVRTHDNVALNFETAGLGSRSIALALDCLIAVPLGLLAGVGWYAVDGAITKTNGAVETGISIDFQITGAYLLGVVVFVLYFVVSEGLNSGRTWGKKRAGIRVVHRDGSAIGFPEAALRNLTKLLGIDFVVGPLLMFFHPLALRLGDIFSGTMVTRERIALSSPDAAPVHLHIADPGPPIPGIGSLGPHEITALRTILARPDLHPFQRYRVAAAVVTTLLDRIGLPADAAERTENPEWLMERMYLQLVPAA